MNLGLDVAGLENSIISREPYSIQRNRQLIPSIRCAPYDFPLTYGSYHRGGFSTPTASNQLGNYMNLEVAHFLVPTPFKSLHFQNLCD